MIIEIIILIVVAFVAFAAGQSRGKKLAQKDVGAVHISLNDGGSSVVMISANEVMLMLIDFRKKLSAHKPLHDDLTDNINRLMIKVGL